jgi:ProP effector
MRSLLSPFSLFSPLRKTHVSTPFMTTSTPGPETTPEACSPPTNPTDKRLPSQNARQLLKDLQEKFPVFRDSQPLAIGIDKQLMARLPGLER